MKLAILLLVHGQPYDLPRLVERFSDPDITIFVHVDGKVEAEPFHVVLSQFNNVVFLPRDERIRVNWGGRSQLNAILNLHIRALKHERRFDWFLSLTGSDYPVCTPGALKLKLSHSTMEIARIDRVVTRENDNKIRPLSLHDSEALNPRNFKGMRSTLLRHYLRLLRIVKLGPFPEDLTVVHGSASHCLSRNAVEHIIAHHTEQKEFYELLRHSFGADEFYIHTILFNAGFNFLQDMVNRSAPYGNLYGMHYIDWSCSIKNPPKMLDLEDLDGISETEDVMFVRKVDLANHALLDALDALALRRS